MTTTAAPEQRTIDVDVEALDARGRTLHGYAAVYGAESADLGGFRERIAPGAFADVLASADVRCLLNHDPSQVLARSKAGTLRLHDEQRGLRFEADLPDSPLGQNVREAVRRGDIDGASFRFKVGDETWDGDVRTVTRVAELHDVTVATYGAYPAASVELRTRNPEPAREADTTMPETETTGGLAVEDRTADTPSIEQRVTDALLSIRKGESRSLTDTNVGDGIAPPEFNTFIFDRLRAMSVALRAGVRVLNTERENVVFPTVTADANPAWYGETDTIAAGDPAFSTVTATPRKLAHRVEFSNEVIDDSEPSVLDIVRDHLLTVLALKLDDAIFEGSGTAPEIRGLRNVAGIQAVTMGANGAALTNLDPFADALGLLAAENVPGPYAIALAPRTWTVVSKLKDTTNRPLLAENPASAQPATIYGVPAYATSHLSVAEAQGTAGNASSAYVFAPAQVVLVNRQDAVVELDRSRLFDRDMSELRAKLRADLIAPQPKAIVRIQGITP